MTSRRIHPAALILFLAAAPLFGKMAEAKNSKSHHANSKKTTHTAQATRTTVVVHEGFPLRRTWPTVIVHAPARPIQVSTPSQYLPVSRFASDIYRPPVRATSWQNGDTIWPSDNWVETTLNVNSWGRRLFLSIGGQAQVAFAEVVFENGEARVVDFGDRTVRSGRYHLLDFPDGRRVDHVRVVARARSDRATLTMFLES